MIDDAEGAARGLFARGAPLRTQQGAGGPRSSQRKLDDVARQVQSQRQRGRSPRLEDGSLGVKLIRQAGAGDGRRSVGANLDDQTGDYGKVTADPRNRGRWHGWGVCNGPFFRPGSIGRGGHGAAS